MATTTMITSLVSLLLLVSAATISTTLATSVPPSTGNDWISLDQGVQFQPAPPKSGATEQQARALRQAQQRFLDDQSSTYAAYPKQSLFVDSKETYYDAYAQAWRYVGFYTDCNPNQDNDRRRRGRRELNEDEESPCTKYLLWAAYVDLDYSGGGIGEYQFFDTYTEQWDTSACETVGNVQKNEDGTYSIDESTCRKCDCHMPGTRYQLLGYFKEIEYTEWFEQLFKHEGYCVWQGDEYEFMYENYNSWPEGCEETEVYLSDGTQLYTDTKALPNATMTYGLYTDARCAIDYTGDEVTLETLLADDDNDALSLSDLEYWNQAMEIYRVCQPCRAYALHANYGNDRHNRRQQRKLEDDPNNGYFQCDDAAGYSNVNQCMKFRSKTDMEYATWDEVLEAAMQGGITSLSVSGKTYGAYRAGVNVEKETPDWQFMWIACGVFGGGLISVMGALMWSQNRCRGGSRALKEPLIRNFD